MLLSSCAHGTTVIWNVKAVCAEPFLSARHCLDNAPETSYHSAFPTHGAHFSVRLREVRGEAEGVLCSPSLKSLYTSDILRLLPRLFWGCVLVSVHGWSAGARSSGVPAD